MIEHSSMKAYARASGGSKSCVQNRNTNIGSSSVAREQGEAMSGSKGPFPKSLIEFQDRFSTESACAKYLFERRWPEGFICPGCGDGRAWLRSCPLRWCRSCG